MTKHKLVQHLNLEPHPEGGWYRQTWAAASEDDARPAGTAIYFLLHAGEESRWHRVDAAEIWHFYAGAPLILSVAETEAGPARDLTLGADISDGAHPQIVVPEHHWQMARSTGDYTLVGCTVSPGFRFEGFEMAPEGFDIPRG